MRQTPAPHGAVPYVQDFERNRHLGQWAHGAHRLTGIIIVLYLLVHIVINSLPMIAGTPAYDSFLMTSRKPLVAALEFLLVVAIMFHLLNGVRLVLVDIFPVTRIQKRLLWAVVALFVGALFYFFNYGFFNKIFPSPVVG